MKFKMLGSGGEGAGAGWIGKEFFGKAGEIYETEDPEMIDAIIKSKMAIQIIDGGNSEMKLMPDYPLVEPNEIKVIQEPIERQKPTIKRR